MQRRRPVRRARADGRGGHALHPLHVRHDRQAEGHRPHHRRLSGRRATPRRSGSSTSRTRTSYWCTADIGWVTGHSYVVYGPLANGATVLMYEGAPDWPEKDRFWEIVERHGVTIFYTAPTAIRAFMNWGAEHRRSATICAACACSARSASRSTPKRGCGTTSTSAASAARSSTPGGRPRPGTS